MVLSVSITLLILLIIGTFISTIINWKSMEGKNKTPYLYLIFLMIQILILIISFIEKNHQNNEITKLNDELSILKIFTDVDETNNDVKAAIAALVSRNEIEAKAAIQRADSTYENFYPKLYKTAMKYKKNENYKKSKHYFQLCRLLKKDDSYVLYNLAILEQRSSGEKNAERIINSLESAIELNPNIIEAYISLGEIWNSNGDFIKAEKYFKSALNLNGRHEEAQKQLAFLYFSNDKLQDAIFHFENLIDINPSEADYYFILAKCFYNTKSIQKAKLNLKKALDLEPDEITYLEFKIKLINDPEYQKFIADLEEIKLDTEVNDISISEVQEFTTGQELFDNHAEPDCLEIQEISDSSNAEDKNLVQTSQKYSRIKLTIFNASNNKQAANNLGYLLREEYGVRYTVIHYKYKCKVTSVYYFKSNERVVAQELVKRLPGTQKFGPLPKKWNNLKYRDIIIFLGNDCSNISSYQ